MVLLQLLVILQLLLHLKFFFVFVSLFAPLTKAPEGQGSGPAWAGMFPPSSLVLI